MLFYQLMHNITKCFTPYFIAYFFWFLENVLYRAIYFSITIWYFATFFIRLLFNHETMERKRY
jgi:hypothetical protein